MELVPWPRPVRPASSATKPRLRIAPGSAELQLRIPCDNPSVVQFSHSLVSEWTFVYLRKLDFLLQICDNGKV